MKMLESKGRLVNNFEDFRQLLADTYTIEWLDAPVEHIEPVFGLPKKYPAIITFRVNQSSLCKNIELQIIYLAKKPTILKYCKSCC